MLQDLNVTATFQSPDSARVCVYQYDLTFRLWDLFIEAPQLVPRTSSEACYDRGSAFVLAKYFLNNRAP